jgi:hypothetical protein
MQSTLNNQNRMDQSIIPLDFDFILASKPANVDISNIHSYVRSIVETLNKYFAIHMDGEKIGKIRITRFRRNDNHPIIDTVTVSKAKQLFPLRVNFTWKNKKIKNNFDMNVIDLWLRSPKIRNELYCTERVQIRQSPVVLWLETQLSKCPSLSTIRFGGLNSRKEIYRTFLNELNDIEKLDWTAKRISQEFYAMLPESRPKKARIRLNGVPSIFLPQFHICKRYLEKYKNPEKMVSAYLSSASLPDQKYWNRTGRAYPDVSALAGGQNGYCVSVSGDDFNGFTGTSASTPVWSAVVALLNSIIEPCPLFKSISIH